MMRRSIVIALTVVLCSGCVHIDGRLAFNIQGQVVDGLDGSPQSGVTVALVDVGIKSHWAGGDPWASERTDDSGRVCIHLDERFGYARLSPFGGFKKDFCVVEFSQEGYKTKRIRYKDSEWFGDVLDMSVVRLERKGKDRGLSTKE